MNAPANEMVSSTLSCPLCLSRLHARVIQNLVTFPPLPFVTIECENPGCAGCWTEDGEWKGKDLDREPASKPEPKCWVCGFTVAERPVSESEILEHGPAEPDLTLQRPTLDILSVINYDQLIEVRMAALHSAVSLSELGEEDAAVLTRANLYASWIVAPILADID